MLTTKWNHCPVGEKSLLTYLYSLLSLIFSSLHKAPFAEFWTFYNLIVPLFCDSLYRVIVFWNTECQDLSFILWFAHLHSRVIGYSCTWWEDESLLQSGCTLDGGEINEINFRRKSGIFRFAFSVVKFRLIVGQNFLLDNLCIVKNSLLSLIEWLSSLSIRDYVLIWF